MKNLDLREVNDDILSDLLEVREERFYDKDNIQDVTHVVYFDEIAERILKNVPAKNKKYVKNQLNFLDQNFMDYISYWNEKYYRNGFCDGVELISGCLNK